MFLIKSITKKMIMSFYEKGNIIMLVDLQV